MAKGIDRHGEGTRYRSRRGQTWGRQIFATLPCLFGGSVREIGVRTQSALGNFRAFHAGPQFQSIARRIP